jgi:hypothetical protein
MRGDSSIAKTDYSHGIYAQTARDIFHRLSLSQYRSTIETLVHFMKYIVAKFLIYSMIKNVYMY